MILNIVIKIIVKEVGNIIFIYDSNTISNRNIQTIEIYVNFITYNKDIISYFLLFT